LGPIPAQILAPLDIALWCFIGVEGAVAFSGRARNKEDVGKATLLGFIVSLVICFFISVLPFGVLPQKALSTIPTPSTPGILKTVFEECRRWSMSSDIRFSVGDGAAAMLRSLTNNQIVTAEKASCARAISAKEENKATATWPIAST
ncbi:amino acid permease, partial [Enterobacter quasiroggenkampii]|nr:amino acid permease [Enterobacter quasiroggenkampii]